MGVSTISTYSFDDLNCECMDSQDESVRQISEQLYLIHDDTIDHPISVTSATWKALIRIVAFLDTDLTADEYIDNDYWPFKDDTVWNAQRTNISKINIPSYNPDIHALPVHGPLSRIPMLVGLGIIALAVGLLVLLVTTK